MGSQDTLLRIGEAASLLGVTPQAIRRWESLGEITIKRFGTQRRLTLHEVLKLADKYGQPGDVYVTFHAKDFASAEFLKAVGSRLPGVTCLDVNELTSIIVSALANLADENEENQCQENELASAI